MPDRIGPWERIVGPETHGGDRALTIVGMIAAALLAAAAAIASGPIFWLWWQWLIVLAVATDLGGGMIANALPSIKYRNHTPGTPDWRHFGVALIHLHLPLMALVLPNMMPWRVAWLGYAWLVGGTAILLAVPMRWRLAAGLALTAIGTVLIARLLPIDGALGWMPLALFVKILAGHLIGPDRA